MAEIQPSDGNESFLEVSTSGQDMDVLTGQMILQAHIGRTFNNHDFPPPSMSSTVGPLEITSSEVPGKAVVNNSAANRNNSNGLTLCFLRRLPFHVIWSLRPSSAFCGFAVRPHHSAHRNPRPLFPES